jgi:hypothetical protein
MGTTTIKIDDEKIGLNLNPKQKQKDENNNTKVKGSKYGWGTQKDHLILHSLDPFT